MHKGGTQHKAYPKTLSDRIYIHLKESIMKGDIKPNQRVMEKDIAAEFGISTTPVREAILRLSGEGLIRIDSHKEAVVRELSHKELMNIYEAMVCIDEKCVQLAYKREKAATIEEMTKYMAEMDDYWRKSEVEKYLECNEQMHLKIAELCGNEFLFQMRQMINAQLGRYRPLRLFMFSNSKAIDQYMTTTNMLLQAMTADDMEKIGRIEPEDWIRHLPGENEWLAYKEK